MCRGIKLHRLILLILLILIFISAGSVPIKADEDLPEDIQQIVRLKKTPKGDLLCFNVTVAKSSAQVKYRTIGWIIKINDIGIIYKYLASESNSETFSFRLTDLEKEFKRQYGDNTSQFNSVMDAMYKYGGTITFDAINTVSEKGRLLGAIVDNPVYGELDSFNYIGEVYDTLPEIANARNWSSRTKNVDLPKYYGISYNFSPQPHVDGLININFLNATGKKIRTSITIERKFALDDEPVIKYKVPNIFGYCFDEWRVFHNNMEIERGCSENLELTLSNNMPVLTVDIVYENYLGLPDLKIVDITPSTYSGDSKVLTIVKVKNVGKTDFGPDNLVDVRVFINSKLYTRKIDIGRNKEVIVPFVWETPSSGTVHIDAEVNYNRKHYEINYKNNRKSVSVSVRKFIQPDIGESPPVELVPLPVGENNCYKEWKEWRFSHWEYVSGKKRPVYIEKSFWVKLNIESEANRETLKSGYGFGLNVPVSIETNYDRPEFIIPPQRVLMYLPEKQYNAFLKLQVSESDNLGSVWNFPVNNKSVLGNRYHYIPIWFPDEVYYHMNVTAIDCYCPGGSLSATSKPKIWVNGNMYEDDYIGRMY